jgi:hypothetical protein
VCRSNAAGGSCSSESSGLSDGAIAGIAIACVVGLVIIALTVYFILFAGGSKASGLKMSSINDTADGAIGDNNSDFSSDLGSDVQLKAKTSA